MFCRVHRHADPAAPVLLLLHGWTASADLQWYSAFEALAFRYSFVAVDHHGHGRGIRDNGSFSLAQCADDAAAVVRQLGFASVIPVGYSMGGPIGMEFISRHPELTAGFVACATALDWSSTRRDRFDWSFLPVAETVFRSRLSSTVVALWARRVAKADTFPHREWVLAELRRNDPRALVEAGRELHRFDGLATLAPLQPVPSRFPTAMVVTTRDRLVPPRKQRELAAALGAQIVELPIDHGGTITDGLAWSAALCLALESVTAG